VASQAKTTAPSTILLVEGNAIVRKLCRIALEKEGFLVKEASSGATALALARLSLPDLIIQDLMIEDTDAIQLARDYRAIPGGDRLPVVAMSGLQPALDLAKAVQVGFVDFLAKPVEIARLIEVVRTYLPHSFGFAGVVAGAKTILVVDDNPLQLKLTRFSLEAAGFATRGAANGLEALKSLREKPSQAVVSDVFMPGLDGLGLCEAVLRDPKLSHIPVLLYSAVIGDPEDQDLAKRAGASELVVRSTQSQGLVNAVARAITSPGSRARAPDKPIELSDFSARKLRQAELQAELNARLIRRLAVQEIRFAFLAGAAKLVTTTKAKAIPDALAADCMTAARIESGAIFALSRGDSFELTTRFGPIGKRAGLATFFNHPDLLSKLARRSGPTTLKAEGAKGADAAVMRGAGCARMTVTPLLLEGSLAGALVTVPMQPVDEYYDHFIELVSEAIALALGLIRQRRAGERIGERRAPRKRG